MLVRLRPLKVSLRPESSGHQQLQRPETLPGTGLVSRLTHGSLPDSSDHHELILLQLMNPVDDAKYNSSYSSTRRHGCAAKTREAVNQTLQDWATNPTSEKILWMNGMGGTGKTTIAYSFCEWLEETNQLGASFFCSRMSSTCRSSNQIIPAIAYQLARVSPAFRSKLCVFLSGNPDAGRLNMVQQFEKLIHQPILDANNAMPDSVVVVVDALDECDDTYNVHLVLDLLLKHAEQLPLKFFVSSRPKPVIKERMMSQGGTSRSIVCLHDIEESIVEKDIKSYLTEALGLMISPPTTEQIEILVKRSRNSFIYASIVVQYLYEYSGAGLELLLKANSSTKAIFTNTCEDLDLLDALISAASKSCWHEDKGAKDCMQRVLWTVVCAREPVTLATIASLTGLTEDQVWSFLQLLRLVVDIPEPETRGGTSYSNLIPTLHASFSGYIFNESRSREFFYNGPKSNETMVHQCFDVMKMGLKFNICALASSYVTDDQVHNLEARITRSISPTLSYACRYWSSHLQWAPATGTIHDMLLDFLSKRLLFWMEVLSLCRCIEIGAPMMQQAQYWLRLIMKDKDEEIQKQVSDARNFVTWFAANPCSRSTPHIYISALPFCAKSSWVYQHYFQRTKGLANISTNQHDEALLATWSAKSEVHSVAISPNGDHIATGNGDGSVCIYNMHTGSMVAGPFQGHTNIVLSVAFSPDGRHIASGSKDNTVIAWEGHTGRIVTGPLNQHTAWVRSVAFSPDSRRIVSGSDDKTIIVWDSDTGDMTFGPLKGHSDRITSVAFSPNGQLIASGSYDHTIRLWDASTGDAVAQPLIGHKGPVLSVAFSPDGTHLASGSGDKTARVWDVQIGALAMRPLEYHTGAVISVAFSLDGSQLATGDNANDHSIIVWHIPMGSVLAGPFRGHTASVNSVVFSPDGTRIISCSSDRSIRMWDAEMRDGAASKQRDCEISIGPIAFSSDCSRFISNSSRGVLRVWNLHTGEIISPLFELQTEPQAIHAVAFSPSGTYVAASTNDYVIRIWDAVTGQAFPQPFRGHTDKVGCVVFSPDGARFCSGSNDATIILWDIHTGVANPLPCNGHTGLVQCVAYSPNGTYIASGSTDAIVRVWDPSTHTMIHVLSGHTGPIGSVAFSPDGSSLVSGGLDGIILKWDVDSGAGHGTLFGERTGISQSETNSNANPSALSNRGNNTKASNTVNYLTFSADGAHIACGFDDSICILDSQTGGIIHLLSTPGNVVVRWVGFSSVGASVVSALATRNYGLQMFMKQPPQKSPKSPNIVHVWNASTGEDSWSQQDDGRVISKDGFVLWLPFDLRQYLELVPSGAGCLDKVLLFDNFIEFGHERLCIGNEWSECYTYQN